MYWVPLRTPTGKQATTQPKGNGDRTSLMAAEIRDSKISDKSLLNSFYCLSTPTLISDNNTEICRFSCIPETFLKQGGHLASMQVSLPNQKIPAPAILNLDKRVFLPIQRLAKSK